MDRKGSQIVTAILAGGVIGGVIAVSVNQLFWWVGVLVGGLVGYLTYEPREVAAAARQVRQSLAAGYRRRGRAIGYGLLRTVIMLAVFTMFVMMSSIPDAMHPHLYGRFMPEPLGIMKGFILVMGFVAMLVWAINANDHRSWWWLALYAVLFSPPVIYLWMLPGCAALLLAIGGYILFLIYFGARTAWGFVWNGAAMFLNLIHSHERVLCGIWASVAVTTAYFLHWGLIGVALSAIAAAMIGHYEYQLVAALLRRRVMTS